VHADGRATIGGSGGIQSVSKMDSFALVLIGCGGSAVLALVLSMTSNLRLARRLAQFSLWLALAAIPFAIAVDMVNQSLGPDEVHSKAFALGRAISHAMNYATVALPCAAIAGLALRRANSHRRR
jgi:hypothetical protein